jgi:threonine aldolase
MLGGGMRQAGVIAAAALYALENHVERLSEDHDKAQHLAEGLTQQGYDVSSPQTNMVFFKHPHAASIVSQASEQGVAALTAKAQTIRLVTHLDVSFEDIDESIATFGKLLEQNP